MDITVIVNESKTARLTTEHPASSYNQPICLIDGTPYGVGDTFDGKPIFLVLPKIEQPPADYFPDEHVGDDTYTDKRDREPIQKWNRAVGNHFYPTESKDFSVWF